MRKIDFWYVIYSVAFIGIAYGALALIEPTIARVGVGPLDLFIIATATYRMIRLIANDKITAFVRAWFYDKDGNHLPEGPRRAVSELLVCQWCVGIWAALIVAVFYFLSFFTWFIVIILAVAGLGTFFRVISLAIDGINHRH